ncbi:hypothetical protein HY213_03495 [Candidatus Peregrinibacteria bacterium]|nr:hypothetical protein [Candidatus Peregrinibacteria bacterium]
MAATLIAVFVCAQNLQAESIAASYSGSTGKVTVAFDDSSETTVSITVNGTITGFSTDKESKLEPKWTSVKNYFTASGRTWKAYGPLASEKPLEVCGHYFHFTVLRANGSTYNVPGFYNGSFLAIDPKKLPKN